jgi:hypothetical protein
VGSINLSFFGRTFGLIAVRAGQLMLAFYLLMKSLNVTCLQVRGKLRAPSIWEAEEN